MCIWLCEERPVQPSGWEPALVQNYASVNVSCWSADSKEEINKRWQREDPQSKKALEKDFNLWDWLHTNGELSLSSSHKKYLDRACLFLHIQVCPVLSDWLITDEGEVATHQAFVQKSSTLLFHSTAMEIQLSEAWSSPLALQAATNRRQPGCAMSPQRFDCFLRSPVLTITSKNHFSSSQEAWPVDRSCTASARREHR